MKKGTAQLSKKPPREPLLSPFGQAAPTSAISPTIRVQNADISHISFESSSLMGDVDAFTSQKTGPPQVIIKEPVNLGSYKLDVSFTAYTNE